MLFLVCLVTRELDMCCWHSFLLFFREEANYAIKKDFRPTFNFCILLDMWSNLWLSSLTFAIKMHTIVSEVRTLFCNEVLQYYRRKTQSLHNTASESYANILSSLHWLVCRLFGNKIIFSNPLFFCLAIAQRPLPSIVFALLFVHLLHLSASLPIQ